MRRLNRYLLSEIWGPLALGFAVYTFILLVRVLFVSAEMIIRRGVPAPVVGELLLWNLPNIVVLTLPMSLLFGILTAVGRLASDSELIAIRSSGVSLLKLYRPILTLSVAFTLVNVFLMSYVLPWGNTALQQLRLEMMSQGVSRTVEPRIFYEDWQDKVLYVFDVDPVTDRWQGVFLAQSLPAATELQVIVADWGEVRVDAAGERVVLTLGNAEEHKLEPLRPERYQRQSFAEATYELDDAFTSRERARITASKGVRELTLPELAAKADDPGIPGEMRNLARVEIHKKFAIPFAAVVFGLFALPLGFNNRRGGKASGFALSIAVIMVYYVLLSNGEEAARYGKLAPWLAMWLPNLALAAVGVYLLIRRDQDKGLLPTRLDRWLRRDVWSAVARAFTRVQRARRERRRAAASRAGRRVGGGLVRLLITRPRLTFPSLMDRYTLRIFGSVLLTVLLSILAIYVIADLTQFIDEILKNHVAQDVVVQYYLYSTFQVFYDLAPIVVLVTTLITFSLLSRTNEVTAAKALGMSLYRLALPVVVAALLISAFSTYLESAVLPVTNQRAQMLEDKIRANPTPRTYSRPDRWLFGKGGYIYNFLTYDQATATLQRLQVFELGEDHRLKSRLAAATARFDRSLHGGRGGWLFTDGWIRRFDTAGNGEAEYQRFAGPVEVDLTETQEFFVSELRRPEQMGYGELKRYIVELEASGQPAPQLKVDLQKKVAFPVTSLVMALVALPFAFRLGRQGALYGVGLSIALGMVFFGVLALFTELGRADVLPPTVAVWAPSAVFATLAVYLFLGVRS